MAHSSSPPLLDIATFIAVADNGSFTRAAEQLGITKSNVGKAVQRLEAWLSTRLFQRTTRAVRLTEDGELYLDAARVALDGLADAQIALAARRQEPAGKVRIDLAVGLGLLLLPTFAELRKRHPKVTLDISLNDKPSDPVAEGWDIVVRIGELPSDGVMTVKKLCVLRKGIYASPAYLESRQPILSVEDLAHQEAILFRGGSGRLRPWLLQHGNETIEMSPNPSVIVADGRTMIDSTINGMGIAQIYDRVAEPYLRDGRIQRVLPEADVDGPPVHALIPLGHRMPLKTRVVLDHIAAALRRVDR